MRNKIMRNRVVLNGDAPHRMVNKEVDSNGNGLRPINL